MSSDHYAPSGLPPAPSIWASGPPDINVAWYFEGAMRTMPDKLGIDVVRGDRMVKAWSIFTLPDLVLRLNNLLLAAGEKVLNLRPEQMEIDGVHVKSDRTEIAVSLREVGTASIWPVYVRAADAARHAYANQEASRQPRHRGRPAKKRKGALALVGKEEGPDLAAGPSPLQEVDATMRPGICPSPGVGCSPTTEAARRDDVSQDPTPVVGQPPAVPAPPSS